MNEGAAGDISHHPLLLSCRLEEPWHPREIVCEQSYMEVLETIRFKAHTHQRTLDLMDTVNPCVHVCRFLWRNSFLLVIMKEHNGSHQLLR